MPTRLHTAAVMGDETSVKAYCDSGRPLDDVDTTGSTAVHWAAKQGHTRVVQLLIDAQASPNIPNKARLTPLDLAKKNRRRDVVELLSVRAVDCPTTSTRASPARGDPSDPDPSSALSTSTAPLPPLRVGKGKPRATRAGQSASPSARSAPPFSRPTLQPPRTRPAKKTALMKENTATSVYSSSEESDTSDEEEGGTGPPSVRTARKVKKALSTAPMMRQPKEESHNDDDTVTADVSPLPNEETHESCGAVDDEMDPEEGEEHELTHGDIMSMTVGGLGHEHAHEYSQIMKETVARHAQKVEEDGQLVIFLSSPFNGLRDERDIFINRYLPTLRARCENKGIAVKVMDLRWGISSKQSAEGMTLTICLRGVRDSNIFLGFYGARYGTVYNPNAESTFWVKRDFDVALQWKNDDGSKKFGWINKFTTRAVTELEFRAGWLNNPGERLAAFYFRDLEYDKKMANFYDNHDDPEQRAEARHYKNPFEADYTKLARLRRECTDCAPTSTYYEPSDAAQMFHSQCDRWLDWVLPKGGAGAMGAEDGAHKAFASARTQMYVQDADQVGDLASTILEDSQKRVLLLVGPSGSGKSALLANLVKRFSTDKKYADHAMLTHYIGCSSESTNLGQMLRRLVYHLQCEKRRGMSDEEAIKVEKALPSPDAIVELTSHFNDALRRRCAKVAKRNPKALFVLVIDALSQLDPCVYSNADGRDVMAHDLEWFPKVGHLPDNLRIVVSSLPSHANPIVGLGKTPIEVLEPRADVTLKHAYPLSKNDRHQFCKVVLDKAGKNLKDVQLRRVVYGEAYMIPAKERRKDRKNAGSAQSVYYVRDAGCARVHGKYLEHRTDRSDGQPVYVKTDDSRYRLLRREGKWMLNELYVCPHGTDTPPSLGWTSTNAKHGDPPQVRCLQPPTHLPLFLKLAMEELCAFGLYEELDRKIREISSCGSIPTLLLLMLDRLENGMEDKHAVRNVFSQIWCSRNGMMAAELCELAGIESEAAEEWALLFSAVRPFLVERGGRFTFLHNYIKDAVAARYCPTTGHRWAVASMQFYYFHPYLTGEKTGNPERIARAREELDQLDRFVEAKVLREPVLEAQTEELDFTGDNVGPDVAKAIGQGLMTNSRLMKLVLAGNAISDKGCEAIALAIKTNRVLVFLDLSSNGITNEGAAVIGEALAENHVIAHVNVSDNKISGAGAKALAIGVEKNKSVVHLDCSNNSFLPAGAKDLAHALRDNSTIKVLRLENNSIADKGAIEMATAIRKNKVLSHLYLGDNKIRDEGCLAIFKAAAKNTKLIHLALNDNEMSARGAQGANDLLQLPSTTLSEFNFEGLCLGDHGIAAFAPSLAKNHSLLKLNLNDNRIGLDGAKALNQALTENISLETLSAKRNDLDEEGLEFICEILHCPDSQSMQKYLKLWKYETSYLKQWKNKNQLKSRGHHYHHHHHHHHHPNEHKEDDGNQGQSEILNDSAAQSEGEKSKEREDDRTASSPPGRIVLEEPPLQITAEMDPHFLPHWLSLEELSLQLELLAHGEHTRKPRVPKLAHHAHKKASDEHGGHGHGNDHKCHAHPALTNRHHDDGGHHGSKDDDAVLPVHHKHGKSAIKFLDLSFNRFGVDGGKIVAEALQSNSCLETLRLDCNDLTDDGGEKIFEALKVNTSLSELYLQNCGVGDVTMKVLGEALASADNRSLNLVDLSNHLPPEDEVDTSFWRRNCITDEGVRLLASQLDKVKAGCMFRTLILTGNNDIHDVGARSIAYAMLENHLLSLAEVVLPWTVHPKIIAVIAQVGGINSKYPPSMAAKRESEKKAGDFRKQLKRQQTPIVQSMASGNAFAAAAVNLLISDTAPSSTTDQPTPAETAADDKRKRSNAGAATAPRHNSKVEPAARKSPQAAIRGLKAAKAVKGNAAKSLRGGATCAHKA